MMGFHYGVLTNQLVATGLSDADDVARAARHAGFDTVQIGPTLELDENTIEQFRGAGLNVSDLIYCRNVLGGSQEARREHLRQIERRIDFAAAVGITLVTTSAGYLGQSDKDAHDRYEAIRPLPVSNIDAWASAFGPLLDRAAAKGVRIAIENCPLMQNWAIGPEQWHAMFDRIDAPHLGLVYDPSHLVWLMIDPIEPISEFADRIFNIHAKDTAIDRARLARVGILGDFSWWRYAIPGTGETDWVAFFRALLATGYAGPITLEHEDDRYAGSLDAVLDGLKTGLSHLQASEAQAREIQTA